MLRLNLNGKKSSMKKVLQMVDNHINVSKLMAIDADASLESKLLVVDEFRVKNH